MKRSMTKAKANTEQINRGQIGQPAACMMVNKVSTPENFVSDNYGPVTHPHELWITLGIRLIQGPSAPHKSGESTD
jgi:hypothetical protein